MVDIPEDKIMSHLTFDASVDPESLGALAKAILSTRNQDGDYIFAPWVVYTDKEYAKYVEFGTRPATKADPGKYKEKHKKMEEWLRNSPGKQSKEYAQNPEGALISMMKYINKHGTPPRPFIRPAMRAVGRTTYDDCTKDVVSKDGENVIKQVAEDLHSKIIRNLVSNLGKNGNPGSSEGLKNSFETEEISPNEWSISGNGLSIEVKGSGVPDPLWSNPSDMGVNNKLPRFR